MNAADALAVFREEMNDEVEPYLWSDALIYRYLDEAQKNFCRWTEGIEDATSEITEAELLAGESWLELDKRILKVREVVDTSNGRVFKVHNMEDAPRIGIVFNGRSGPVQAFVTGFEKHMLRAWPTPVATTRLALSVFRLPLNTIKGATSAFEVDEQHHMSLLLWVKARAYGKEDAETFNRSKAGDYEGRFRAYCAEARKEQERLRRETGVVAYGGL